MAIKYGYIETYVLGLYGLNFWSIFVHFVT